MKPETLAARGAHPIDPTTGALVPPIHTSTTFARRPDYGLHGTAMYARDDAPTFLPAEELLARLEATRARLEATEDPEQAIEVLAELSDLAKQVEAELQQARREAGAGA